MAVRYVDIDPQDAGQRVDNYLIRISKGVPKTRLYRAIRKGEVRINKGRVRPSYRLQAGDCLRIPPLTLDQRPPSSAAPAWMKRRLGEEAVVYENSRLIVLDKPSGMAVHGGTGESLGLIEALRLLRPEDESLELVHRLDKGTSGCLLIAKKRSCLRELHALLRARQVRKQYLALVKGVWQGGAKRITEPLYKNILHSGERVVRVDHKLGKSAVSRFIPLQRYARASLVLVEIETGRTHQIRVHAAHIGHPVAGDDKYGDDQFNAELRTLGLRRLFLHSASIDCRDPQSGLGVAMGVPLSPELAALLLKLA